VVNLIWEGPYEDIYDGKSKEYIKKEELIKDKYLKI